VEGRLGGGTFGQQQYLSRKKKKKGGDWSHLDMITEGAVKELQHMGAERKKKGRGGELGVYEEGIENKNSIGEEVAKNKIKGP